MVSPCQKRLLDQNFTQLPQWLNPGDLLIFNDTRVIPARFLLHKKTGGLVECLLEQPLDDYHFRAMAKGSRLREGLWLYRDQKPVARLIERQEAFWLVETVEPYARILDQWGVVPLPPYLHRDADAMDTERYQTVYARHPGAVAAPTAGLHFDRQMMDQLYDNGIESAFITLHVGAGTFAPVRSQDIINHQMHAERVQVSDDVCARIIRTRETGGRVIAVGTTVVRALETAAASGNLQPLDACSKLFIYPGYRFRIVDALLTNFHLPGSTLLMLVCAYAGRERTLEAYRHAIEHNYRFYSYGDAMLITETNPSA